MAGDKKAVALLAVEELAKSYGKNQVLGGVSFSVEKGSIVALAGANGSGKSTLLRCLSGALHYEGSAKLAGRELRTRPATRRLLGYLPQQVTLPESVTAFEALLFFARLRGAEVDDLTLPEGFLPELDSRVGTFSGGQRQRVAIAISLLGRPPLLLLDEPVANLDERGREEFWHTLIELRDSGTSALIASPSPGDLGAAPDRIITLSEGEVESDESWTAHGGESDG